MNTIDHTYLAQLRPEKFDDAAVNEQILLIQKTCDDVDPDIIAIVFYECNHNMQQTIARLQARDYEDGGWQKARSNNKKKNHITNSYHTNDQIINGNPLDNNERSLSQRTSPTSSLRDGHHRNDRYQYPISTRSNAGRRGNDFNRNHFNSSNSTYPSRKNPIHKSIPSTKTNIPSTSKSSETASLSNPSTDEITQKSSVDKSELQDETSQSVNIGSMEKKVLTRRISQKPVSMHRTINCPTKSIDIQFGDIQWNDSVPTTVTPTDDIPISIALNNYAQERSTIGNTEDYESDNQNIRDGLSSNYIDQSTMNEADIQFLENTNQLSSSSSLAITDNTLPNNLSIVSTDGTSHLSDHLTDPSSSIPAQTSFLPQVAIPIPITRLPPTSTPTPLTMPNNLQQNPTGAPSSAFTPFNNLGNYPSVPRDYPSTTNWNPQSATYKPNTKTPVFSTGAYPQQSTFQFPPQQQQQIYLGHYPYPTLSPSLFRVFTPVDPWSTAGYSAPIDTYSYAPTNYPPTYSNQQTYHQPLNKYDFFNNYGQSRSLSNDALYQQQQPPLSTTAQSTKDAPISSKLSPTAAAFSQGAPLTASPSAPSLHLNPVNFSMPNYLSSVGETTHQDRLIGHSSVDNRDIRVNNLTYGTTNNRNHYYQYGQQQQQQQQRVHHSNASNSTWHSQHSLNWDRIPTKIKRAIEASLEHLNEHKFVLNETNIEVIDDYCWDLIVCHLKQLLYMNLAHNKLKNLPSHVSNLVYLRTLNLTNNHLEELPSSIVLLSNLRILKLGYNQLSSLPRSFSSLKSLEILDLTGNDLNEESLTNDFFQLCNLRALYLGDNLFETFPNDHIDKLGNLQILVLRHNRLRHIPKELTHLPQLKELHIQQNQINVLPPEFGQLDLGNVKHIYRFEPNPFIPEIALQMSNLTRLANFLKIRVIVRCRPMNQREIDLTCRTIISMDTQLNQVLLETIEQRNEPPKQFTFDAVYPENSVTETLYADSVFPLVENVLEGYNATVFAYGQTGCGKSYTMQGMNNTSGSSQRGVIPRSFEHIFEASSVTAGTKYLIRASYLEIYNESIRDLLSKDVKASLDLKEHVDKGVYVPNLTWHQCTNVNDCERLMDKGNKNRATGATLMNKDSSRSHSIFTILTEMCTQSELDGKEHIRAGKLNLVDLAGSERQSKTHAEGDRLREATRINLSLSALGNVISALVDGRSKHIPYRDSKLTRLLQDSLGGNTKTLMIAAISPAHDNYEETLSTLRCMIIFNLLN
ncbi:hypothetical protein I4U23_019046 [Adineta vaga]|nr:hypothetical protein I4U23_019046 [Adineta vaga]